jgi:hypothetical protein
MHFDVIGDIHGHAHKLKCLLRKLGYTESAGWRPPNDHQAIFLGDLIDRGPSQLEVVRIVRSMRDKGFAQIVMGNHEFNAIGYTTLHRDGSGEYLRRHSGKNVAQHKEFLSQVGENSAEHKNLIQFFKSLPPALDLEAIRVVHAWWNQEYVDAVMSAFWDGDSMDEEFLHRSYDKGSKEWAAMEGLTKGLEIELPGGASFFDHDGFQRYRVRTRWWVEPPATYRDVAIVDAGDLPGIPLTPLPPGVLPPLDHRTPIFIGHYWMQGIPMPQTKFVACVDYSAARNGPLVAYRWQGESELSPENFVAAD